MTKKDELKNQAYGYALATSDICEKWNGLKDSFGTRFEKYLDEDGFPDLDKLSDVKPDVIIGASMYGLVKELHSKMHAIGDKHGFTKYIEEENKKDKDDTVKLRSVIVDGNKSVDDILDSLPLDLPEEVRNKMSKVIRALKEDDNE